MIRHIAASIAIAVPVGILSGCNPAPESPTPPAAEASPAVEVGALSEKAVGVVDHLVTGNFGPVVAQFDATMASAMPESLLATTMSQLEAQMGAFQRHTEVREVAEAGYDTVLVTCVFEKATLNAKVVYNAQGQIAGLFFIPI